MFEIKYHFAKQNSNIEYNLDESSLRYQQFLGSLELIHNDNVLVFDWDWIPLLDFAISLLIIAHNLAENKLGEENFEFTESDDEIIFKRNFEVITIHDLSSNIELHLAFENFRFGISEFCKRFLSDILSMNSNLKRNKLIQEYTNNLNLML